LVIEVGIFTPFAVKLLIAATTAISKPSFAARDVPVLTLVKFIKFITLK
jgi:hypothetical protein